jgi:hypothetical protein
LECVTTEKNSKGLPKITFCGNYIICKHSVHFRPHIQAMKQLNAGYVRNVDAIYCIPYSIHVLYKPGNFLWKWFKIPSTINFRAKTNNWWCKKLNKFILKEVQFHSKNEYITPTF